MAFGANETAITEEGETVVGVTVAAAVAATTAQPAVVLVRSAETSGPRRGEEVGVEVRAVVQVLVAAAAGAGVPVVGAMSRYGYPQTHMLCRRNKSTLAWTEILANV